MFRYIDIPPVWALLIFAIAWLLAQLLPIYSLDLSLWWAGILVMIGFVLILWAFLYFMREHTPIEPRRKPTNLISKGPYRINRNPIYTGLTIILLGGAVWIGDIVAFLPVIIYPAVLTRRFIRDEEKTLRDTFGDQAKEYLRNTRRW